MAGSSRRADFRSARRELAWFSRGEPFLWLNAGGVTLSLLAVAGLVLLLAINGLTHFWPAPLYEYTVDTPQGPRTVIGARVQQQVISRQQAEEAGLAVGPGAPTVSRLLVRKGNRDLGTGEFAWLLQSRVAAESVPPDLVRIERTEWGPAIGRLVALNTPSGRWRMEEDPLAGWQALQAAIADVVALRERLSLLESERVRAINRSLERVRLEQRSLGDAEASAVAQSLDEERQQLLRDYGAVQSEMRVLRDSMDEARLLLAVADGQTVTLPLSSVVKAYRPNTMSTADKLEHWLVAVWEFLSTDPREANSEGGVYPAIVGTVVMVLVMALLVTPFGVLAAVYLHEYARQDWKTRLIRIVVNNLAGVPSIVYGVFGLGFFIYVVGGEIDRLLFPEALPAPTFGAPGLLWASVTLALLTLPVVIVATEEGLARIPASLREGSFALGATRYETLRNIVLPIATPAMMTGVILAIARAAGEVAPLMLVGVVKLAPALPVDGQFPFLHLDQQFMHLGYHVFDVGFQSSNTEAARPLVYATALLLVILTVGLNIAAVVLRNRLRERYKSL